LKATDQSSRQVLVGKVGRIDDASEERDVVLATDVADAVRHLGEYLLIKWEEGGGYIMQ